MKFQLLCLNCDDPLSVCGRELLLFLNEFGNFILAEHTKAPAPWHKIHRKSSIWESKTLFNENPSHSDRKPCRLVFH
jgi:hypothetical protein